MGGGLVAHVFKIFISNQDVQIVTLTWIAFVTLLLISLSFYSNVRSDKD